MENREMHQLQREYIQQTNFYLASLKLGVSGEELQKQKERIKELSRELDQQFRTVTDPSSHSKRLHG